MEREPLHLIEALGVAVEMVEALVKAHERGIVHRDLKPANVMLGLDGHIKVMDFGLARDFKPQPADSDALTRSKLTKEGSISGTVGYMSPEQARGERTDARSDVFSFGTVLYEMVFGVPRFRRSLRRRRAECRLERRPFRARSAEHCGPVAGVGPHSSMPREGGRTKGSLRARFEARSHEGKRRNQNGFFCR